MKILSLNMLLFSANSDAASNRWKAKSPPPFMSSSTVHSRFVGLFIAISRVYILAVGMVFSSLLISSTLLAPPFHSPYTSLFETHARFYKQKKMIETPLPGGRGSCKCKDCPISSQVYKNWRTVYLVCSHGLMAAGDQVETQPFLAYRAVFLSRDFDTNCGCCMQIVSFLLIN